MVKTARGKRTALKIVLSSLAILILLIIFGFFINRWSVTIAVNGSETVVLEYGATYVDEGAAARFHGSLIFKKGWPVELSNISELEDTKVVGTQEIYYYAEAFGIKAQAKRVLKVMDMVAPELILQEIEGHYTLPGQMYEEEGFSASDNVDGDLTAKVTWEEKDGKVYYSVEDSSGNKTEVTREIFYDDPIAPELTLVGEAELTMEAGQVYEEPGFLAVDNVDGDLTGAVQVSGNVDENVVGTYTITYAVADTYGNTATMQRIVTIVDTTPPELTLKGKSKITLEAGSSYNEAGCSVEDLVDGDLTDSLQVTGKVDTKKLGTYTIIYAVTDKSGNSSEIVRTVEVVDTTAPKLTLKGNKSITLNVGSAYKEAGYTASDNLDGNLAKSVKVKGSVDSNKLGTYTITYTVEDSNGNSSKSTRTITVIDTTAPKLTLKGDKKISLSLGTNYTEAGYLATDNYDGDLTASVKVNGSVNKEKIGTYTLTYSIADTSGNKTSATRTIYVYEKVAPELTLQGESTITIDAGTKYAEPGYTAIDNYDGNITSLVKVEGKVNIYMSGTYTLTYKVADSSGNTASAKRTIVVKAVPQPDTVTPEGKIIYLTFDDGPGKHTQRLLDVLAKYNVKVTFFTVNTAYAHLMTAQAQAGHTVAIHSSTHNYAQIYASEEAYFADLTQQQNLIEKYTGIKTTLVRFPGGSSNKESMKYNQGIMTRLTQSMASMGYQYFDWNVDSKDAGGAKTAEEVFQNVIKGVQKRNISNVLQHDIKGFSVDAVEMIISWGLANGYTFLPLDATSPAIHHPVKN